MPQTPDPARAARAIAASCLAMRTRRLARLVTRIYDQELRPLGLGASQCNILVGVAMAGEVRPADLAKHLDLEKSTLSRNVARMLANGWLRTVDADDGRSHRLQVTAAGARLLVAARPAWQAAHDGVCRLLGSGAADALDAMTQSLREP